MAERKELLVDMFGEKMLYLCIDGVQRFWCVSANPPEEPPCQRCSWRSMYEKDMIKHHNDQPYYRPLYTAWKGFCIQPISL